MVEMRNESHFSCRFQRIYKFSERHAPLGHKMSEARGLGWPVCLFYNIFECPKLTAYCAKSPNYSEASQPSIDKMSQRK